MRFCGINKTHLRLSKNSQRTTHLTQRCPTQPYWGHPKSKAGERSDFSSFSNWVHLMQRENNVCALRCFISLILYYINTCTFVTPAFRYSHNLTEELPLIKTALWYRQKELMGCCNGTTRGKEEWKYWNGQYLYGCKKTKYPRKP